MQSPAPTAHSFADLPPELLLQILSYATVISSSDSAIGISNRSSHLRSLSLQPALRYPSQCALWDDLSFSKVATVHKWLSSQATQRGMRTARLELIGVQSGAEGLSAQLAGRVLAKVRGVNELIVRDFGRLSAEKVLGCENLRGLKHLVLMSSLADRHNTLSRVVPTFTLSSLTLTTGCMFSSPALLHLLLSTSRHTLTSLYLSLLASSPAYSGIVSGIELCHALKHLSIQHRPSPELIAALAKLHQLESLTVHSSVPLDAALSALPAQSLRKLELQFDYNLEKVVTCLRERMKRGGALEKVERIVIPRATRDQFVMAGQASFIAECAERGVKLEIDDGPAVKSKLAY